MGERKIKREYQTKIDEIKKRLYNLERIPTKSAQKKHQTLEFKLKSIIKKAEKDKNYQKIKQEEKK